MKNLLKITMVVFYLFVMSCASQKNVEDEEFSVSDAGSSKGSDASLDDFESDSSSSSKKEDSTSSKAEEKTAESKTESKTENKAENTEQKVEKDEFAELESENKPEEQKQANNQTQEVAKTQEKGQDEAALEDELNKVGQEEQQNQQALADQNAQQTPPPDQQPTPPPEPTPAPEQIPPQVIADPQQQQPVEPPPPETPPPVEVVAQTPPTAPVDKPVEITGLKYKANDNGGTILIEATGPFKFTKRKNEQLNQFVIEVENAILPTKFMRTLNTKDMIGTIGAVDAYQNKDSKIARFVVQLRGTGKDLAIQQEGASLIVVGEGPIQPAKMAEKPAETPTDTVAGDNNSASGAGANGEKANSDKANLAAANAGMGTPVGTDGPLQARNLEEFLSSNQVFTGKKISLEMQAPVVEVIKIITEESGANIIIDDSVINQKGSEKISFKLREVPWDQALVTILKMKHLAYSRVGNVLRITMQDDLKKEQTELDELQATRSSTNFKVRMYPLSYTKPEEMEKSIQNLLTSVDSKSGSGGTTLGKILKDVNTNSLIVTDSEAVLDKIGQVIKILDVSPKQVSIEAKIVEAKESFARSIGVKWGFTGSPTEVSQNSQGAAVNLTPTGGSRPTGTGGVGSLGFTVGTLDVFGSLDASLSLGEREDQVRVVASPRVVTLNNNEATIEQEDSINTLTNQNSTVTNGVVSTSQTVTVTKAPLKLVVTPTISNDGFVKMDITFNKSIFGALVPNVPPPTQTRNIKNKVIVKDGQTTVIGGVFSSSINDSVEGVPGLKDIPFLGALFRAKSATREKNNLLIFITPKILNQFTLQGSSESFIK